MSKVRGDDVVVLIFDSTIWKPYACAVSCSLSLSTEMLETSEVGAGNFATFRPAKHSFEGSIAGLMNLGLTGSLALSELRAMQLAKTKLLMRFTRTALNGSVYTDEAYFYITKTADEGGVGVMNSFTVDLKGTGALTTIFTPTPITGGGTQVEIYNYTGTGGETTFTDAAMINKDIVGAFKDGVQHKIILSGTPIGKEVKYTISTGSFQWGTDFQTGETAFIQYQDL